MTAQQWFERLPEFVAKNAIAYLRRRPELKDKEFASFREALKVGFDWRATKEGEDFWRDIYREPEKFIMNENKRIELPKFYVGKSVLIQERYYRTSADEVFGDNPQYRPWKTGEIITTGEDSICVRFKKRWWGVGEKWFNLKDKAYKITTIDEI